MATPAQIKTFFRVYARARAEIERHVGEVGEAARHAWIWECTRRTNSLRLVRSGNEFAQLMLATAQAAEEYELAAYWEGAVTRRHIYHITALLRQLGEITGRSYTWDYARGILTQMRLPANLLDVPESLQMSVVYALDTHRRRLLRRAGWGENSAFKPAASYPAYLQERLRSS